MPLLARTSAEAHLYMDFTACETCGHLGFSGTHATLLVNGKVHSSYHGPCPRCGTERRFEFRVPDELRLPQQHEIEFGGGVPSELLDPGEWLLIADLASRRAPAPDAQDMQLAAAAIDEVVKFIPDGADAVPPEAFRTDTGRGLHAKDPGRFRRRRLEAVANAYRESAEAGS
jgi:hypothetical protein